LSVFSQTIRGFSLEHAKHDSADKGECDIRGNNANPVDEGTGENHGEDSLVPHLTPEASKRFQQNKSALLSLTILLVSSTWLKSREINPLKSP
jgi:hypothetical protein